jgi:oligoribonuclease
MTDPYGTEVIVSQDIADIEADMAWVDMETTGLNVDNEIPLEVGCIITDKDGRERATFRSLILSSDWEFRLERATPFVVDMHLKNNLKYDLAKADTDLNMRRSLSFNQVDNKLREFLDDFGGRAKVMPMAGSTINFDRDFMRFLPMSLEWFHYRNMDVTSLSNFCRILNSAVYAKCPQVPADKKTHRVLEDIRDSIKLYQFYKDNFLFVE